MTCKNKECNCSKATEQEAWESLDKTVQQVKDRNADLSEKEVTELVNEAVRATQKGPEAEKTYYCYRCYGSQVKESDMMIIAHGWMDGDYVPTTTGVCQACWDRSEKFLEWLDTQD